MRDRWIVLAASFAACACWQHAMWPIFFGLFMTSVCVGLVFGFRFNDVYKLVFFAVTCASVLSLHAHVQWHALDVVVASEVQGIATLYSDPEMQFGSTHVRARVHNRVYQLNAKTEHAPILMSGKAGERYYIRGIPKPLSSWRHASLRRRHVAAELEIRQLQFRDSGHVHARMANGFRGLIEIGSHQLSRTDAALLTGFVYGDNRNEPEWLQSQFRDAGLSHLLAVSGQNVAFVLLLIAPLLMHWRVPWRFLGITITLVLFGIVTRWEPSVMRATAMALVGAFATWRGYPVTLWRLLAIGTLLALLVDPFLIGSIGFLLSTFACIGMAAFGGALTRRLVGPAWLRATIGYSAAAQIGVLPVQLIVFRSVPLVGLLTNLLAEPVAGLVMIWGVLGGLASGLASLSGLDVLAETLHYPTLAMLRWIASVAAFGAMLQHNDVSRVVLGCMSACVLFVAVIGRKAATLFARMREWSA